MSPWETAGIVVVAVLLIVLALLLAKRLKATDLESPKLKCPLCGQPFDPSRPQKPKKGEPYVLDDHDSNPIF